MHLVPDVGSEAWRMDGPYARSDMPGFKQLHKEKTKERANDTVKNQRDKDLEDYSFLFFFLVCLSLLGHFIVPFLRK